MRNTVLLKERKGQVSLDKFSGEWVALIENKVIAHSKTLEVLMKGIEKYPLKKKPSVLLVPRKEECPYILTNVYNQFCRKS
ncbi:hypothetical protein KAS42_01115 [bacterium]|nr:hypothetical protein [bacterium]